MEGDSIVKLRPKDKLSRAKAIQEFIEVILGDKKFTFSFVNDDGDIHTFTSDELKYHERLAINHSNQLILDRDFPLD